MLLGLMSLGVLVERAGRVGLVDFLRGLKLMSFVAGACPWLKPGVEFSRGLVRRLNPLGGLVMPGGGFSSPALLVTRLRKAGLGSWSDDNGDIEGEF